MADHATLASGNRYQRFVVSTAALAAPIVMRAIPRTGAV
jgi:hypothetical protein